MTELSRRIRQADIAKAAGVSTATVSRALNGTGVVTEDARARINAAINQLGYMPHGAAKALASRRSHTVGAVIPTLASAIFAAGIDAFEQRLNEDGFTLLLSLSHYDPKREALNVRRLLERGVDALMLVGSEHPPETFELIERAGVPHVLTWAWNAESSHPHVGFSNFEAAQSVASHLAELGHTRIAMIAGIAEANDRATQRVAGTRAGLEAYGLELPDAQIVQAPYTHAAARKALQTLINSGARDQRPTAIVCGNDVLATGALIEARAQGIAVPQELSITGFDDLPLAAHLDPGLTTIAVPAKEMGTKAAEALLTAISTSQPAKGKLILAELVERGTTAAPG